MKQQCDPVEVTPPNEHSSSEAKKTGEKDTVESDTQESPRSMQSHQVMDNAALWTKSIIKVLAFADSNSAKIIGITGIHKDVGSNRISQVLAKTFSTYGKRILYIDASTLTLGESVHAASEHMPDLSALSTALNSNLFQVDLQEMELAFPPNAEFFRSSLDAALNYFYAIVVNLPSAEVHTGQQTPALFSIGTACDTVLLVCVTGRTTQSEMHQCLASSKLCGMNIEGILLNDFQLPLNNLLTDI